MVEDRLVGRSERAYAEALIAGHGARQAGVRIGFLKRRRELAPAELLQRCEAALASARKRRKMRQSGIRKARRRLADMQRADDERPGESVNATRRLVCVCAWRERPPGTRPCHAERPISGDVRTSTTQTSPSRQNDFGRCGRPPKASVRTVEVVEARTAGVGRPSPLSTPKRDCW